MTGPKRCFLAERLFPPVGERADTETKLLLTGIVLVAGVLGGSAFVTGGTPLRTSVIGTVVSMGGAAMALAIARGCQIRQMVTEEASLTRWNLLWAMMGVFLLGYVCTLVLLYLGMLPLFQVVGGAVFGLGAAFVLLVVDTSLNTIHELQQRRVELVDQIEATRHRQRELDAARRRSDQLSERLNVLNRVFRHDIRNDANVILGYTDLVEPSTADGEAYLDIVQRRTDRIVTLAGYVQKADTLWQDNDEEGLDDIEIDPLLNPLFETLENQYPELELTTTVPDDGVVVSAHPLVESALWNLLENAVEHNDAATPQVDVRVEASERTVTLFVCDNGPGLPDSEREVLERGSEDGLRHSDGMGLWLSNWIVTYSRGTLEIADDVDSGSEFVVRLRRIDGRADERFDGRRGSEEVRRRDRRGNENVHTVP
ncbi:hypothetical protein AUR64_17110 [Haloprofundus marisrubri]|uniref:histidine kinase n=1 Tax=Haloprofundus marisrubri TaxID=1514971 RepID=A0A0W1R7T3_9EURY|nr:HAMP domain-containing sensor histidine kinase [Haloprofundus marisrubri]KTG09491.1 hypothetical protein AUR64_17110 [Haloprofundus marisrubri]